MPPSAGLTAAPPLPETLGLPAVPAALEPPVEVPASTVPLGFGTPASAGWGETSLRAEFDEQAAASTTATTNTARARTPGCIGVPLCTGLGSKSSCCRWR